jgi:hypothetical protein
LEHWDTALLITDVPYLPTPLSTGPSYNSYLPYFGIPFSMIITDLFLLVPFSREEI